MDAIVAFHSIDDSGSVLSYAPHDLEVLLDRLLEQGVAIVPLAELVTPRPAAAHRVALTFDDGMKSVRTAALPLLAKRKLPFTVFVVSEWVGRDNRWPSQPAAIGRFELMDWAELAELIAAGGSIGGHTANHVHLRALDAATATHELTDSKARLQERLGIAVDHFAYPYGTFDAASVEQVRRDYSAAVTTRLAYLPAAIARDPFRLPRLDSWYLRAPADRAPLFSGSTRAWIGWRALLRSVKGAAQGAGYGG